MIRRLKKRFVTVAMLSLLGILLVVLVTVNLLFWRNSIRTADNLLAYLAVNDGGFHLPHDDPNAPPPMQTGQTPSPREPREAMPQPDDSLVRRLENGFRMNPETAFRTRCFSVIFDLNGAPAAVRTDRIAAITDEDALAYARRALESGKARGFDGIYRYYVEARGEDTFVGFLDCNDALFSIRLLLALSGGILLFCLAAMWLLLFMFSGKVIRPVIESFEKQKQFIADAGHELKTPLTIITADAAVLSMTGSDNEWVQSIQNQVKRLDRLVRELLTLSRMEADAPLMTSEFSISDAADDTVGAFSTLIAARNRILSTDIQPGVTCRSDEESLRRLISILMDNAVKYTPDGGSITFTLKKNGHNILIETRNTCAPIDKKHLPRLFERFYRVDAARTQSSGGYGIGLSIAREIVHKHHGKISAACPSADTIVFTVTLPVNAGG
ncbi:MAG: GHKL domain-containing protein [Clostridiales bacterium]|nr:GHKL domain-containing protein [Clostridiales bacterium]